MAPLRDVAAWAAHLPPESATARALDPHWQRSNEVELLRVMEHGIRVLAWQRTEDGKRGRNAPEPIPLPWDPPPEGTIRGDAMTWDEAADFLGWGEEMSRYFNE